METQQEVIMAMLCHLLFQEIIDMWVFIRKIKVIAIPVIFLSLGFLVPVGVKAIAVSPAIIELSANRAAVVESTFKLINTKNFEQTYYLKAINFEQNDDFGTPKFLNDDKTTGLPSWVQFPYRQISVPASTKIDIPFNVIIPSDVEFGSYWGAVMVSDAPYEIVQTNGVSVSAKTAILVFLTIEGNTVKNAALLDFVSDDVGVFKTKVNTSFQYRLQNQGNVYLEPKGEVVAKDMFGRVLASVSANENANKLLPKSTRTYEGEIASDSMFVIGPVTISLNLNENVGEFPIIAEYSFWVVSWGAVGIIALLFLLIVLGVIFKKKNK
ncbi:MAG: hypothetical protein ABIH21_02010 [Patescibacteria group bacterium]